MADITHIGDLKPDPQNLRRHNPRNIGTIADSLHEIGAARSIVIDEDGIILAGNGVIEAAGQAGIERVQVVDADGETIIAVRRRGLTARQKKRLALFDNRTAELAGWEVEALAEIAVSDKDLLDNLFTDDELGKLLAGVQGGTPVEEGELSPADEIQARWQIQPGQLWEIPSKATPGKNHRLLCGDSTKPDDVARLMNGQKAGLMATDPPYGVDYVEKARDMNRRGYGHSRASLSAAIQSDEEIPALDLMRAVFSLAFNDALLDNAAIYVWHAQGRATRDVLNLLADLGLLHHQTIIWVKERFVPGRCDYQWAHEPIFYGWQQGKRPPFYGNKSQTTVWAVERERDYNHPTQKPVAVFVPPLTNHLLSGEIAYEPFAGSGTQFVAAEQTGRLCYGIEIAPAYTAVCLERLAKLGLEPCLVTGDGS